MKKIRILCCCLGVFVLFSFQNSTKNSVSPYASEVWLAEHFGKKFISSREVGLGILPVLFTIDQLKYDKISWVMPCERNGVVAYRLIQGRYNQNNSERNDTLSLADAKKVISIARKAHRQFPNDERFRYLKTGDIFTVKGVEYAKTIVLDQLDPKRYSIFDLPTNVDVVLIGSKTHNPSYVSNIFGGFALSLDLSDIKNKEELIGTSVMTLVELIPSQ